MFRTEGHIWKRFNSRHSMCGMFIPTFGRFFVASVGMRIRWDNEWFEQLKSHYFCKFNFFPSWFHHPFGQTTAIRFGTVNLGLKEFQNSLNSVNRRHAHFRKVMCVFFPAKIHHEVSPPEFVVQGFFLNELVGRKPPHKNTSKSKFSLGI